MKELIFEVVIAILILSLLVVVIGVFRGNMDIVGTAAQRVDDVEKVKADSLVPLDKNVVLGSDVVSVVRFYNGSPDVEIYVKLGGGVAKRYDNSNISEIPYDKSFKASYTYDGKTLKSVFYEEM